MSLIGCSAISRKAGAVATINAAPNAYSSLNPNVRANANITNKQTSAAIGVT